MKNSYSGPNSTVEIAIVGGRHQDSLQGQEGGPCIDNCTPSELLGIDIGLLSIDEYIELRKLRIQPVWLKIACEVGYQKFVSVWNIFDNHGVTTNTNRVYIPKFSSYVRHQVKELVRSCIQLGFNNNEIIKIVSTNLGLTITPSKINYIRFS